MGRARTDDGGAAVVHVRWACLTDVGRMRARNEDACDSFDLPGGGRVFAVADGLGGHPGGDVASRLALQLLRERLEIWARGLSRAPGPEEARAALVEAFHACNRGIRTAAREHSPRLAGMATTLTAALVQGDAFAYAHVGDSRLYRIGRAGLEALSRDDGFVAELTRRGRMSEEQARRHPRRHMLTQALGIEQALDVDSGTGGLGPGEGLLLCTDGLTVVVEEDEIWRIVHEHPPEAAARRLVALANERGGPDNVTIAVVFPAAPAAGRGEAGGRAS